MVSAPHDPLSKATQKVRSPHKQAFRKGLSESSGAADASLANSQKAPLKTHSRFRPLKRSQAGEFRAVQKSRISHHAKTAQYSQVLRETAKAANPTPRPDAWLSFQGTP